MTLKVWLTRGGGGKYALIILLVFCLIYSVKPWEIAGYRSTSNMLRNAEIHNAMVYEQLPDTTINNRVILNCKSFEDVELMFYRDVNAYHWYLSESQLDSLQREGYQFSAFKSHNDQHLPTYIQNDPEIVLIDRELK